MNVQIKIIDFHCFIISEAMSVVDSTKYNNKFDEISYFIQQSYTFSVSQSLCYKVIKMEMMQKCCY